MLAPFEKRTGKLPVKLPTVVDVRFYYMCVELPDNKLKTMSIKLDKGFNYTWTVETKDGKATCQVLNGIKVIETITVPAEDAKAYGFAATVR